MQAARLPSESCALIVRVIHRRAGISACLSLSSLALSLRIAASDQAVQRGL